MTHLTSVPGLHTLMPSAANAAPMHDLKKIYSPMNIELYRVFRVSYWAKYFCGHLKKHPRTLFLSIILSQMWGGFSVRQQLLKPGHPSATLNMTPSPFCSEGIKMWVGISLTYNIGHISDAILCVLSSCLTTPSFPISFLGIVRDAHSIPASLLNFYLLFLLIIEVLIREMVLLSSLSRWGTGAQWEHWATVWSLRFLQVVILLQIHSCICPFSN